MRLLLDTHAFLWWLNDDSNLDEAARASISSPSSTVWVSTASIWEVSIKRALGKLQVDIDRLIPGILISGFIELPISAQHAVVAGGLPSHHKDPFDRMLIAQAQIEELTLVTRDSAFGDYGIRTLPI
ncbi:MAG TPA: type II toxin-antitoxin system VapC family toxin [Thermoanaerobaculia bacterium]|nr:type II toxin-antitoxin system VapC family toxin [Thermoanaerobaculia bacterium]